MPYFFFETIEGGAEKTVFLNFCQVLFNAFQNTNDALVGLCQFARDRLGFTGQVLSLETFLNQKFPSGLNGFSITCLQNTSTTGFTVFNNGELPEDSLILYSNTDVAPLSPIAIWLSPEVTDDNDIFGIDFIVNVPNVVVENDDTIRAFIDLYAIAPQNYIIERYMNYKITNQASFRVDSKFFSPTATDGGLDIQGDIVRIQNVQIEENTFIFEVVMANRMAGITRVLFTKINGTVTDAVGVSSVIIPSATVVSNNALLIFLTATTTESYQVTFMVDTLEVV